jgi:tRNA-dihydrouridine synthase A
MLQEADRMMFGCNDAPPTRNTIITAYRNYMIDELRRGTALHHMSRHLLGLFNGLPGARRFRRHISENAHRAHAGIEVIDQALTLLGETHHEDHLH